MRKITLITISTVILLFIATMILISTKGFKTDKFNNLISQKVNQINPKIKLNEVISQLNKVREGRIVKDSQVSAVLMSYELIKELEKHEDAK